MQNGANETLLASTEFGEQTAYHYARELGYTDCEAAFDRFDNGGESAEDDFEQKVQLILTQHAGISRKEAERALIQSNNDVVDALLIVDDSRRKSLEPQTPPPAAQKKKKVIDQHSPPGVRAVPGAKQISATKLSLRDAIVFGAVMISVGAVIYYVATRD